MDRVFHRAYPVYPCVLFRVYDDLAPIAVAVTFGHYIVSVRECHVDLAALVWGIGSRGIGLPRCATRWATRLARFATES